MSTKSFYDTYDSLINIAGSIVSGILAGGLSSFWFDPKTTPQILSFIFGFIATALTLILIETVSSWRQRDKYTQHIIDTMSSLSAIRSFKDARAGLENDISIISNSRVRAIYNTVLRYGYDNTSVGYDPILYKKWVDLKSSIVIKDHGTFREIISTYIQHNNTDQQMRFVEEMHSCQDGRSYKEKYLDDIFMPMLQLCIVRFSDGTPDQVLFGHQHIGNEAGPCFLSKDSNVVNYFRDYFDHWWNELAVDTRHSDQFSGDWLIYRYLNRESMFLYCDMWKIRGSEDNYHVYPVPINKCSDEYYTYKCRVTRRTPINFNVLIDGTEHQPQQSLVCFISDSRPTMMIGIGAGTDSLHKTGMRIYIACRSDKDIGEEYAREFIKVATERVCQQNNWINYIPDLYQIVNLLHENGFTPAYKIKRCQSQS